MVTRPPNVSKPSFPATPLITNQRAEYVNDEDSRNLKLQTHSRSANNIMSETDEEAEALKLVQKKKFSKLPSEKVSPVHLKYLTA